MPFIITKRFEFEAAHFISTFPDGHKCRRVHGHTFKVEVKLEGESDEQTGILIDFGDVKKVVKPYIDYLDHSLINDLGDQDNNPYLQNPTSENICKWLYKELAPKLPMLRSVVLHETSNNSCEYYE